MPSVPRPVNPAGTEGTTREGPKSGGSFMLTRIYYTRRPRLLGLLGYHVTTRGTLGGVDTIRGNVVPSVLAHRFDAHRLSARVAKAPLNGWLVANLLLAAPRVEDTGVRSAQNSMPSFLV